MSMNPKYAGRRFEEQVYPKQYKVKFNMSNRPRAFYLSNAIIKASIFHNPGLKRFSVSCIFP